MQALKSFLRLILLPWWVLILPRRSAGHPYFGSWTKSYGGPDLKIRRLKEHFGNSLWFSCLYIFSGKPLPLPFVRAIHRRNIPIILDQNGVHYPAWDSDYLRNNKRLQELHSLASYVIYQSAFCQASTQEWVQPDSRPSSILFNPVDTQRFHPSRSRDVKAPFTLLSATYFNPSKQYLLEQLLAVLQNLNQSQSGEYRLILSGRMAGARGKQWPSWANAVLNRSGQSKNVEYTGAYSQSEAPSVYAQGDVLLHLTQMDACPTAVLEAMSCGLPVVYAGSGGTPELVGPEAGIRISIEPSYRQVNPVPVPTVADAIRTLRANYVLYSQKARLRATEFNLPDWLRQHQALQERFAPL